jgi:hypothetical protein
MAHTPRTVYELMNWAAEQHDLDANQRKVLYQKLESEGTLKKSKDPVKDASKYAKDLKKQAEAIKNRTRKASGKPDKAALKGAHKKSGGDLDEISDEFESDDTSDGGTWYEEDVNRDEYPDYYDSDY